MELQGCLGLEVSSSGFGIVQSPEPWTLEPGSLNSVAKLCTPQRAVGRHSAPKRKVLLRYKCNDGVDDDVVVGLPLWLRLLSQLLVLLPLLLQEFVVMKKEVNLCVVRLHIVGGRAALAAHPCLWHATRSPWCCCLVGLGFAG